MNQFYKILVAAALCYQCHLIANEADTFVSPPESFPQSSTSTFPPCHLSILKNHETGGRGLSSDSFFAQQNPIRIEIRRNQTGTKNWRRDGAHDVQKDLLRRNGRDYLGKRFPGARIEFLGQGGYSLVYKVNRRGSNPIAIAMPKSNQPEDVAKVRDSYRQLLTLWKNDPVEDKRILRIRSINEKDPEKPLLFMDYVEDGPLTKNLNLFGPDNSDPKDTIHFLRELALGIQSHFHDQDRVFADLKSDNVLIRKDEQGRVTPVITDYASADSIGAPSGVGTPQFLPPLGGELPFATRFHPDHRKRHEDLDRLYPTRDTWALMLMTMEVALGEPVMNIVHSEKFSEHLVQHTTLIGRGLLGIQLLGKSPHTVVPEVAEEISAMSFIHFPSTSMYLKALDLAERGIEKGKPKKFFKFVGRNILSKMEPTSAALTVQNAYEFEKRMGRWWWGNELGLDYFSWRAIKRNLTSEPSPR